MKTKIEIVNGNTTIILLPENKFEERLIEDWYDEDKDNNISVSKKCDSYYSNNSINKVEITLKEKKKFVEPVEFNISPAGLEPQPPIWEQANISELRVGDLVKHKSGGKSYVVDGVYGDRASAHASADITNEIEWEVLKTAR